MKYSIIIFATTLLLFTLMEVAPMNFRCCTHPQTLDDDEDVQTGQQPRERRRDRRRREHQERSRQEQEEREERQRENAEFAIANAYHEHMIGLNQEFNSLRTGKGSAFYRAMEYAEPSDIETYYNIEKYWPRLYSAYVGTEHLRNFQIHEQGKNVMRELLNRYRTIHESGKDPQKEHPLPLMPHDPVPIYDPEGRVLGMGYPSQFHGEASGSGGPTHDSD